MGFLSLNFSDVPPFRDLGNITSMGVTYAFVLSILFLPALTLILPFKVKLVTDKKTEYMESLASFVIAKRRLLLWIVGIIIVSFISLIPKNEINDIFVEYFDESIEFRRHTDHVSK